MTRRRDIRGIATNLADKLDRAAQRFLASDSRATREAFPNDSRAPRERLRPSRARAEGKGREGNKEGKGRRGLGFHHVDTFRNAREASADVGDSVEGCPSDGMMSSALDRLDFTPAVECAGSGCDRPSVYVLAHRPCPECGRRSSTRYFVCETHWHGLILQAVREPHVACGACGAVFLSAKAVGIERVIS